MLKTGERAESKIEIGYKKALSLRAPSLANILPEEGFTRIAEAPLIERNGVRLLKDADENYPAWLATIEGGFGKRD
jgi:hypothetical protein